jgi:uncharacterized membrane protein YfcA
MALFLSPMQMAGAVLGVLIQTILPNWLYLLIAAVVLAITAKETYQKYLSSHKAEKKKAAEKEKRRMEKLEPKATVNDIQDDCGANGNQEQITSTTTTPPPEEEVEQPVREDETKVSSGRDQEVDTDTANQLRLEYLEQDMIQYPKDKLMSLFLLWIGLVLLTFLMGGKGIDSILGITCESPWYSVLIVAQFMWLFGFALVYGFILKQKYLRRVKVLYPYLEDDPIWDNKSLPFFGSCAFFAGIVAGLIGIGGGMILGPMMLLMGIHPAVTAATNASMVVLTSSSVAVMFVTSGLVPWSYAVFYFFVSLSGAYFGKSKIDAYVKKSGRASLLIFCLATILALATLGCVAISLTGLAAKDWCLDGLNEFCSVDSRDSASCPSNTTLSDRFLMYQEEHDYLVPNVPTVWTVQI